MIDTNEIIDGGIHTISASWKKLDESNQGFRVLTFRNQTAATTAIEWGVLSKSGSVGKVMFLKADESWTLGPDAGTIRPSDIYIRGTAGESVFWVGVTV